MATNNVNRTKTSNRKLFDTKIPRKYDRPQEYTPDRYLTANGKLPTIGYDPQIWVNRFGNASIMAGLQTLAYSILRLLYTVPGQFPDYPKMGIDIKKYLFSFEDEFTAAALRAEILSQLPLLSVYMTNDLHFNVIKTQIDGTPVIVINLASSIRTTNNIEDEININIGITFDEFHKLVNDVVQTINGETIHFQLDPFML